MKKITSIIHSIISTTSVGFTKLCLFLSKGFFFYFYIIFNFISKLINIKPINYIKNHFKKLQYTPEAFVAVATMCILSIFFYGNVYSSSKDTVFIKDNNDKDKEVVEYKKDDNKVEDTVPKNDINLYRTYSSSYNIDTVSLSKIRETNTETVAWITVDRTNINYPVLKTSDNDYYLSHDINRTYTTNGWIFMDYRNDPLMNDKNTIFYGHNLLNKTAFGSVSNLFTDDWYKKSNHIIMVKTDAGLFKYEVFSVYYIDPEVYYLQTAFYSNERYKDFLDTILSRSMYNFKVDLSTDDKIITLSTCTEDNKNRKVVHARKIN